MSSKEQALILYDDSGECTVVQPNEDGSYWRKIVRNKMVRMKESRRVKAAKNFMTELQGGDTSAGKACGKRRTAPLAHVGVGACAGVCALPWCLVRGWGRLGRMGCPPLSLSMACGAPALNSAHRLASTRAGQCALVMGPVYIDHRPGLQEERPVAARRHDAPDGLHQDAGVSSH